MRVQMWSVVVLAFGLGACGNPVPVAAPAPENLSGEALPRGADGPPTKPEGACWGHDTIPAVIETVTQTVLDQPELREASGKVTRPASYNSFARQRILQDRKEVYVRTPCYNQLTPDTIITLQRALKARGYFQQPLSGELDLGTMAAVRHYQADHGLDTAVLSLKAALALGLVIADRATL